MKYYISADGGGTKLLSILFDEEFHLLGVGRGGPVNLNFETRENVQRNMEESIEACFSKVRPEQVEAAYFAGPGPGDMYREILGSRACSVRQISEGAMSLYAGALTGSGIVAVSGTGSNIFYIENGEAVCNVGGWGGLVDDEGSGYYIGRAGITAAVQAYEGRGPQTTILSRLYDKFQIRHLRELMPIIYVESYRVAISGICPLVAEAANDGDEVAIQIFEDAGTKLAEQVLFCKQKKRIPDDRVVLVTGSVWKGTPVMFRTFSQKIKNRYPAVSVITPQYAPAVGGVVYQLLQHHEMNQDMQQFLADEYAEFRY